MASTVEKLNLSLAQWSLHRAFLSKALDVRDFASVATREFAILAVEYVSLFYMDKANDPSFWRDMKNRSDEAGVRNLLIMVDAEGDLGATSDRVRSTAVENHFKWVDAAATLGCHAIRVNARGKGEQVDVGAALVEGIGALAAYAGERNIRVLIENHGGYSSDAGFVVDVIKRIDTRNVGTLPDFGNWCLSGKWGGINADCDEAYDIYRGVEEFMPFAHAVSAKSYDFDDDGNDTRIDYARMLQIVKNAGYNGHIGIEYEGRQLGEYEGIRATRSLIEKTWRLLD